MTSRRNLLAGATALAAGAILPARAATLSRGRDDARLLAHAARTRTFVDRYAEVAEEAHRTFDLVQADPVLIPGTYPLAWARDEIARGSTLSTRTLLRLYQVRQNRIYERHGYSAASDAWNTAGRVTRAALGRLKAMHATTIEGAAAKARVLYAAADDDDLAAGEDITETLAAIVADLERLAARKA